MAVNKKSHIEDNEESTVKASKEQMYSIQRNGQHKEKNKNVQKKKHCRQNVNMIYQSLSVTIPNKIT